MVTGGAIRRPYEANCTESYSRSATPRATPGQLHRERLPVCYTESFSRSATPRATPGLLHRELLPVCNAKKTKTHSRTNHHANCDNFKHHATKQTNPSNWHGPNEPLLCFLPNRTAHCQLLEVSNASAPQAHKYWRTIGQIHPRLRHVMEHPHPFWKRPRHRHSQDHFRSHCTS